MHACCALPCGSFILLSSLNACAPLHNIAENRARVLHLVADNVLTAASQRSVSNHKDSMTTRNVLLTAACSAALTIPLALFAQTTGSGTGNMSMSSRAMQDTTRRQDSTRMRRDTVRRNTGRARRDSMGGMTMNMQDSTRRSRTGTGMDPAQTRQPRATSQLRYRVQKNGEAAGTLDDSQRMKQMRSDSIAAASAALEAARRDSVDRVMQRQRDSVANIDRMRADSVSRIERVRTDSMSRMERARTDSMARVDSIDGARRADMNRSRFGGTGWYVGIAGGASAPTSDFKNLGYNSGFAVNAPIGWHRPNSLLGIRFDFGYNRFSGRNFVGGTPSGSAVTLSNPNPQVLSGTANITLATPMSLMRAVRLYAVGGAGVYHFRSFGGNSGLGGFLGNDVLQKNEATNKPTRNKFGAQVGAGVDWTVGSSSIYLESRYVNVFTDRKDNLAFNTFFGENRSRTLKFIPLVLGVKIR